MHTPSRLAALAAATSLVGALAATALTTAPASAASPRSAAVEHARSAVQAHRDALGVVPGQALTVRDVILDAGGAEHVRFDRTFAGLPVLGGDLVVHLGKDGGYRGADRASTAAVRVADTTPTVSRADASATAAAMLDGAVEGTTATLSVDATSRPALVWDVLVEGMRPDQTPAELHVIVDARRGTVLRQWDDVRHAADDRGFFNGAVDLTATLSGSTWQMKDPTRGNQYTVDMGNKQGGSGKLFTDADNLWGDGTLANRQTVGVDAQYGTAQTWDYFKNTYARNGIANNGVGAYNRVHYGRNYNNAFWSDSCFCMTYGDGDGVTFNPFDSLDVAGHEMTHGVTSRTANLTYSGESGGLNEATSDIFGTAVEFYSGNPNDVPDYLIGEKLYRSGTKSLRYMDRPSRDGKSVDCWSSTVGSLDVHYSSGVANHWFYLMSEGSGAKVVNGVSYDSPTCNGSTVAGIDRVAAERIWYRALTTYMTSSTNYAGARTATMQAATDLGYSSAAVAAAWAAVNVN